MKALIGGTLIDGTGGTPVADSVVVINDERIEAVGRRESVRIPGDAQVLDISGMTLMPGLIDCHDHIVFHGEDRAGSWGLDEPWTLHYLRMVATLKQTLEAGYTTFRDAGGVDMGFRLAVQQGLIPGPRLVLGISIVSPTGGIGDQIHSSGWGHAPIPNPLLPSGVANGVDQVRAKVRELVKVGADVIKIATTGGASSRLGHGPKDAAFGFDEIQAVVDEAHTLGVPVMCHAIGGPGLRMAVEAGVNSIDHGGYLDEDPEIIPMMAAKGIFYVPTFMVYAYHRERGAPYVQERAKDMYPHHIESVHRALAAGIKVVAGTDAGMHVHGNNALELQLLVEAGLSPMQAIVAATGWAAECVGLGDDTGTVQAGKLADLLVTNGNPLDDIALLQDQGRIRLVMKEGKTYVDRLGGALPT